MKKVKVSLIDNDYVIRSKMELGNEKNNLLRKFLEDVNEEFVPGETALVVIEGLSTKPFTLEISR